MKRCNVTPADGRLIWSRVLTTAVGGTRVTDADGKEGIALPRGRNTVGFQITITNRPTLALATATYLLYVLNAPLDQVAVLGAMANGGYGELLAPGQSVVIDIPADEERVIPDLRGIESDFATEAAVTLHMSIKELVDMLGSDECREKSGGC